MTLRGSRSSDTLFASRVGAEQIRGARAHHLDDDTAKACADRKAKAAVSAGLSRLQLNAALGTHLMKFRKRYGSNGSLKSTLNMAFTRVTFCESLSNQKPANSKFSALVTAS